ncbi:hypothetical protein F2Q68_00008943 [Brassica cretica]|uniref:Uncharacterized protein n=1 Tax=Brassica cretica TaxID=69181 RepID=A0A8S9KRB0_BRACR|nr:hypothetical protein F2Q68_00008943 [Brassica cretica]
MLGRCPARLLPSSESIPPPTIPPDPPDPASPLSPIQFPHLSSVFSTGSKSFSSQKRETRTPTLPLTAAASTQQLLPSTGASPVAPANAKKPVIESRRKYFPRSENITVQNMVPSCMKPHLSSISLATALLCMIVDHLCSAGKYQKSLTFLHQMGLLGLGLKKVLNY